MFVRKNTSNWRRPQNNKIWISQQPLIRSFSNLLFMLRGPNKNKKILKWRQPPMEDNPKILKVEYLSNHCSYLPQILTSCSGDQTKIKKYLNWRRPPMEDDLKIFKVEYLSNHWMIPSNFKLTLRGLNQNTKIAWNEDDLQC